MIVNYQDDSNDFFPSYHDADGKKWNGKLHNSYGLTLAVATCPGFKNGITGYVDSYIHYGINYRSVAGSVNYDSTKPRMPAKTSQIKYPGKTILIGDSQYDRTTYKLWGDYMIDNIYDNRYVLAARHGASASGGTVNILWCDGHASGVKINGNPYTTAPYIQVLGKMRDDDPESLWDRDY
jgi:prepilin-type processing-associated H-X9-DG protein